jgi:hypothetical protein
MTFAGTMCPRSVTSSPIGAISLKTMTLVLAILDLEGWQITGRAIHRAIDKVVSLTLVQEAMGVLRRERARHMRREREMRRMHLHVLARDAIWSVDGTHLGRDRHGEEVKAEMLRDVASTMTLGTSIGPPPSSREVVVLLQAACDQAGTYPLVLAGDNGPENRGEVEIWCEENAVLRLRNLPRTPEHNPWVEHGNGEIKTAAGLGKGKRIASVGKAAAAILVALDTMSGP